MLDTAWSGEITSSVNETCLLALLGDQEQRAHLEMLLLEQGRKDLLVLDTAWVGNAFPGT